YLASSRRFPLMLARSLGTVLATVHRTGFKDAGRPARPLAYHLPWLASILPVPPGSFLKSASRAMLELVGMVQRYTVFCEVLQDLWSTWERDAVIHGDFKWDNCVVARRPGEGRSTHVVIIDWEFAGIG